MKIASHNLNLTSETYKAQVVVDESGSVIKEVPLDENRVPESPPIISFELSESEISLAEFKKSIVVKAIEEISSLKDTKENNLPIPELTLYQSSENDMNMRGTLLSGDSSGVNNNILPSVFSQGITINQERLDFSAKGVVKTEDKEITIDLGFTLSRNLVSKKDISRLFKDPLVINFDSNLANVSGEKFSFDIDSDGVSDQISLLKDGSGFLALDKNEDGKINDGSELFGAKSGNGFNDLKAYDDDGNGWIDENDEIFDKLRVWTKTDSGDNRLLALGEVGIGAIFLGDISTEFTIGDKGEEKGELTHTSIFIKTNGDVGTIQNINISVELGQEEKEEENFYTSLSQDHFKNDYTRLQGDSTIYSKSFEDLSSDEESQLNTSLSKEKLESQISRLESKHSLAVTEEEKNKITTEIAMLKGKISAIEAVSFI